jgi:hypothetical protein
LNLAQLDHLLFESLVLKSNCPAFGDN